MDKIKHIRNAQVYLQMLKCVVAARMVLLYKYFVIANVNSSTTIKYYSRSLSRSLYCCLAVHESAWNSETISIRYGKVVACVA